MNARERRLAMAVGALVVALAGYWLFQKLFQAPLTARQDRVAQLDGVIAQKETQLRRARQAAAQLQLWQRQSLPADPQVARSRYQDWLLEIVNRAGLEEPHVDSGEISSRRGLYDKLSFTVRGRGSVAQLTRFLYDFYRTDYLHQIDRLTITPIARSASVNVTVSIEALVVPGAERRQDLPERRSNRLAHSSLADYQAIALRNVFGEGGARLFDPADYAYLTGIVDVDGQPEAWFTLRTTNELLKLRLGQTIEVGDFRGVVAEIAEQDVVLEVDEERWLVALGENLGQATALPPEY